MIQLRNTHGHIILRNFLMVVKIVDEIYSEATRSFIELVDKSVNPDSGSMVAFDCEGVNLGRTGTLEILAVCFDIKPEDIYLIDFQNIADTNRYDAIKRLLQSDDVTKVSHDCKKDCDALFHLHQISCINVHDTSCFHEILRGKYHASLNDVLQANGVPINAVRDKSIYKTNPRFWATRPMTTEMTSWASADVSNLLKVAFEQRNEGPSMVRRASDKSREWATVLVDMDTILVRCLIPVRRFIGRRGCNMRDVERSSNCHVYGEEEKGRGMFLIYYGSKSSLNIVKREMGY